MIPLGKLIVPSRFLRLAALLVLLATTPSTLIPPAFADSDEESSDVLSLDDILDLDLADILKIQFLTTIGRKPREASEVPAAVTVITNEEIRRSGARSIPELLRMVPGLNVARQNSGEYAISARGFNDVQSNKMVLLVDGRSLYTGQAGGQNWDIVDVFLDDVERIEIVRGTSSALWGANAVNGVVNIVMKPASQTQGVLARIGAGTEEQAFGDLRYGGQLRELGHYRLYLKQFYRDGSALASGADAGDEWQRLKTGYRLELNPTDLDTIIFQGDYQRGRSNIIGSLSADRFPYRREIDEVERPENLTLLTRWEHQESLEAGMLMQLAYSFERARSDTIGDQNLDSVNFEFEKYFPLGTRHSLLIGGQLGYSWDKLRSGDIGSISYDPAEERAVSASLYLEDEIRLHDERLRLIIGGLVEYSDFNGVEFQPNVRLAWVHDDVWTLWAAVSRGVRSPSRAERDVRAITYAQRRLRVSFWGSDDYDSEKVIAYEAGFRTRIGPRLHLDAAFFVNEYEDLRGAEVGWPRIELEPLRSHVTIPIFPINDLAGRTYGIELESEWQARDFLRIVLGYNYLGMEFDDGSTLISPFLSPEGQSPSHQVFLSTYFDLPHNVELDAHFRYISELEFVGVDGYPNLDVRLAWRPRPAIELAVVGHNLLDSQHQEFAPLFSPSQAGDVERGVYGSITWEF